MEQTCRICKGSRSPPVTFFMLVFPLTGRKFDLRVYVLVTSVRTEKLKTVVSHKECIFFTFSKLCCLLFIFQFVPLKAWLYREGFARFSNTRYSLSTIDDKCILFAETGTLFHFPRCPGFCSALLLRHAPHQCGYSENGSRLRSRIGASVTKPLPSRRV